MVTVPKLVRRSFTQAYGPDTAGRLSNENNIIDLQNHCNRFCSQTNTACGNQKGLHHIFFQDVGDGTLADVNSGGFLPLLVSSSQLSDNFNWMQAGVLGQRLRDDL